MPVMSPNKQSRCSAFAFRIQVVRQSCLTSQAANAWAPPQAEAVAIVPLSMELVRMPADVVRDGGPPDLLPEELSKARPARPDVPEDAFDRPSLPSLPLSFFAARLHAWAHLWLHKACGHQSEYPGGP